MLPKHHRELYFFESTSMEKSKAREKSLNGLSAWRTARFPLHVLPSVSGFSPRALFVFFVFVSFFPLLSPLSAVYVLSLCRRRCLSFVVRLSQWTLAKPATRKPNNLGHSWQTTPSKCNSGAFSLDHPRLEFQVVPMVDVILQHILPHHCRSLPCPSPSFNFILIFFPFVVFVHHRFFADTLQSERLRGKIWRERNLLVTLVTSGIVCTCNKINGNFLVRHARFTEGHCDLYPWTTANFGYQIGG